MIQIFRFQVDYVCFEAHIIMHNLKTHCSHRLMCWIKSCTRDFLRKIALISYRNDFNLIPFGNDASWRETTKICKKFKFWKFWERPNSTSGSMPLSWIHVKSILCYLSETQNFLQQFLQVTEHVEKENEKI